MKKVTLNFSFRAKLIPALKATLGIVFAAMTFGSIFQVTAASIASISAGNGSSDAAISAGSVDFSAGNTTGDDPASSVIDKTSPYVLSYSTGGESVAVLSDGSLWLWGFALTENKYYLRPMRILDGVKSASAGCNCIFFIKQDGSLWGLGSNQESELGVGSTSQLIKIPVKIMENVKSVSGGWLSGYAIKTDGTLWAWGNNQYGQIGDGTKKTRTSPVKIMENVVNVNSSGAPTVTAIKADGSLWSWGTYREWVDTDGTDPSRAASMIQASSFPVKVMDGVIEAAPGNNHILALKTDHTLWAWGNNMCGQLGDETDNNRAIPKEIMENVANVAAGNDCSFAIKTDGSLWSWGCDGFNTNGQLGLGHLENGVVYTPQMVMKDVTSISTVGGYSLVQKTDGSLWGFGDNGDGSLGTGTGNAELAAQGITGGGAEELKPVRVASFVAVSTSSSHTSSIESTSNNNNNAGSSVFSGPHFADSASSIAVSATGSDSSAVHHSILLYIAVGLMFTAAVIMLLVIFKKSAHHK